MSLQVLCCGISAIIVILARSSVVAVEDSIPATITPSNKQIYNELTEWLNSLPGGYFNPKQEIRPVVDTTNIIDQEGGIDNLDIFYGVYAKELIKEGELLNQVPWKYIINDEEENEELAKADEEDSSMKCGTVRNLLLEMKRPESSQFGPYVKYLLEQPFGVLPSSWSKKGRDMFDEILGGRSQKLPPQEATTWLEEDWIDGCRGDPDDPLGAHAAMQVVSRADDDLLIPVYDMYNHRNGKWYNTHMKCNRGVNHQVTARRDIQPGEQIHNSYNMCDECGGRKNHYGTPEIFRDYGFVEDFPQRWNLDELGVMFDLFQSEENGTIIVSWDEGTLPSDKKELEGAKRSLKKELKKLYKVRRILWEAEWNDGKPEIPWSEWDSMWEYHQAAVDAISYALNDLADDENETIPITGKDGTCSVEFCGDYYDILDDEPDEIKYNKHSCDNKGLMFFPDYILLEHLKTHYQVLNFAARESDGDICLDLEDTLQICSCYRPHYHEYSAHFAARFVNDVRRIIFVGGGDSMLLHESLKYPNLEKVVGLELDQTVTRKTFKYFRTQPHFDDERVEWWFGDATKSLLLLPKDYWGSFDLVLVDLSETVMAFSVTEDLDVFDALALLLKPDGVMVKNELYLGEMSGTFDHTLQIMLENNPKICSQTMAFGSNGVDFFHTPVKDQMVETLLLPPVDKLKDKFEYFHDYRKNNARFDGKCDVGKMGKKENEQGRSAGILHVIDAENVTVPLFASSVEKIILAAGAAEGFSLVSVPALWPEGTKSNVSLVVFKEGYVLARIWEEYNYCALDIGMWGAFVKESGFKKRLAAAFQANTVSAFRVIVGGMYESSTWRDDVDTIGPQIVERPSCSFPDEAEKEFSDVVATRIIVDESTNLAASSTMTAVVICGVKGKHDCTSVDVLEKNARVKAVVPIWTCPDVEDAPEGPERTNKMLECEKLTISIMKEAGSIDLVVLDASALHAMGQIVHSILSVAKFREEFLDDFNLFMTWSNKPKTEEWQRNFLERYRKDVLIDPVTRAELRVQIGDEILEFGLVSTGDLAIFHNLDTLEKKLRKRLSKAGTPALVEVVKIQGGLHPFNDQYNPKEFLHTSYDQGPGDRQYAEQQPLGREAIIQFERDGEKSSAKIPNLEEIQLTLQSTLSSLKYEVTRSETYTGLGAGALMICEFKEGNVVLVWDGRNHIDLNLFLYDDRKELVDAVASKFSFFSAENLQVGLRDDFPRGLGRVVNFKEDLVYQGFDSITDKKPYVD